MITVQSSDVLISKASTGLDKFWQGHIVSDEYGYYLQSTSWRQLAGGGKSKVVASVPYPVTIKNVGKSNETTPLEQAESEFASMVKSQRDKKNYLPKGVKAAGSKLPLPMLAQKYRDKSHKIVWPCFVQPKLDGNRMIFDGVNGQSRGGKPFIPQVIEHLEFDTEGYIIDGELMLPGNVSLQTTMTAIKKYCDLSPTLIYCVYDIVDETPAFTGLPMPFSERTKILARLMKNAPENVKFVETHLVKNEADMEKHHQQFVLDGYEGTILRNANSKYAIGQRSENLQKHKDFMDGEFKIVGVKEGDGLYKGCAIFKCVTKDGEEFDSNPEGTLEYKRELFKNKKDYIGQWLTVRYFETTLKGKPTFNVGVSIRERGEF